jgi:hypothetical protein
LREPAEHLEHEGSKVIEVTKHEDPPRKSVAAANSNGSTIHFCCCTIQQLNDEGPKTEKQKTNFERFIPEVL